MRERIGAALHSLCTKPCRSEECQQRDGYHTHHLTRIGRYRHIHRFAR